MSAPNFCKKDNQPAIKYSNLSLIDISKCCIDVMVKMMFNCSVLFTLIPLHYLFYVMEASSYETSLPIIGDYNILYKGIPVLKGLSAESIDVLLVLVKNYMLDFCFGNSLNKVYKTILKVDISLELDLELDKGVFNENDIYETAQPEFEIVTSEELKNVKYQKSREKWIPCLVRVRPEIFMDFKLETNTDKSKNRDQAEYFSKVSIGNYTLDSIMGTIFKEKY